MPADPFIPSKPALGGFMFADHCPICAVLIPPNNLCCDKCLAHVPHTLKGPYFSARKRHDRVAVANHGKAVIEFLKRNPPPSQNGAAGNLAKA